jgi:mono/diheme cytochrome c family protein
MSIALCWVCLLGGAAVSSTALTQVAGTQTKPVDPLPSGAGKPIVLKSCTTCHTLTVITTRRATEAEWTKTVNDMVNRGADLSDDEIDKVIDYLSTNFKPDDSDTKPPAANMPPPQR